VSAEPLPESDLVTGSARTSLSSQLLHDLRSPLTQIIGYSEMLSEEADGQRREDFVTDVARIRAAGHRMLALIEENFISGSERTLAVVASEHDEVESAASIQQDAATGLLLVVDDDANNRDVLSRRLTRQGHGVRTASNGRDALRLMREVSFDLVLLDIMMPDMDGYEVLGKIKADQRLQHIPVIMISALSDLQSVVRCIEAGAEDYLAKPFNPTLLKARIGSCLEKKRSRDRETALFEQLQANYKRLQEVEKLRDDMRNMIVHDLRTPLTAVIVGVEMLEKDDALNEMQHEIVSIAAGGGKTLLGMINDLLDVEKMEAGSSQLHYEELSVATLVTVALDQVASLAMDGHNTLVTEIASGLPLFPGDANKLSRTLVNLIGNAIKFTRGGTVTITVSQDEQESLCFAIRDTGEGIPPEAFDRIFEKFGQLDSRKVGTGLGLAFCKLAVEAHGGHIQVESTPGAGSTFSFTIPLVRAVDDVEDIAPKRILVADDDPSILRLVTEILKRANYEVDTAANGREALAKIEKTRYDVVMLDLMMPGVSGFDVLARLPVRRPQPRFVVIMSAAPPDVIANAVSLNVFAALRKPFELGEIITTVRACIAETQRIS
jgi:two-component system, sensor histidine kinase and response regulator